LAATDVVSVAVPLFHIGGISSLLPQLYFGDMSVIHPMGDFDGDRVARHQTRREMN
jgi:fatty-acyl-CoA synthase